MNDAEPDAPVLGHSRLAAEHALLDLRGAADTVYDASELGQQAVASVFDDAASMFLDLGTD